MGRSRSRRSSCGRRAKRSRSRRRSRSRERGRRPTGTRHSRSPRSRERAERPRRRSASASPRRNGRHSASPSPGSRRPTRKRSRTPERVPPTSFADYEPATDGSGWYVYKKTGKWKYHPETGLYLHIKSKVYYIQKENEVKSYRKIEDDDDPNIRKMKQSEEMRKAIQKTEFVKFDDQNHQSEEDQSPRSSVGAAVPSASAEAEAPRAEPVSGRRFGPETGRCPAAAATVGSEPEPKAEGKVREWNAEKGFGFIVPVGKEGEENKSIFVHLWNVVGSTYSSPINLREGARVQFKLGEQEGRPRALEVVMLGKDGKPLPVHAGAQTLEEKRRSYFVTADSLGVRAHAESWPGKQQELRDRFASDEPMDELGVCFAVFDGHGGSQVSDLAGKQLHKNILAHLRLKQVQPASRDEKIKLAVKEAFAQTDKEILGLAERKKFEHSGSTALVALLHGNPKLGTPLRLVVAHVGDSRAILCRGGQAVAITADHQPARVDEKKRIERLGGLVLNVRGTWRIAAPANPRSSSKAARREYQGLSMTRSLGDLYFKQPAGLSICEPEVKVVPITDRDLFLVLATDGITKVLSSQEIVDCGGKHWDDAEEAAKNIVRSAFQKGSDENLTALVIQFGWQDKSTPKFIEKRKALVAQGVDGGSPTVKPIAPVVVAAEDMFASSVKDDFDMFG